MTIQELQEKTDAWIKKYGVRYFNEMTNLALLMEEVGELARLIARSYGEQSFKDDELNMKLSEELADVLFVLTCLANQTNTNLTEAIEINFRKKTLRDQTRHLKNKKLKKH
jgi:NTP pyrophosphatase (non-canonical NTP hydrolase)